MEFNNADQLKSFLKGEAKRLGLSINNTYNTYFARLLLERINKWSSSEIYVKGSFSEYGHIGKLVRPITDVDLVSTANFEQTLQTITSALNKSNKKNGVVIEVCKDPYQTKTGIYKISMVANFGKIEHPLSIDFQEKSRTVYESIYKEIKPTFRGDYSFGAWMPTIEEYLAEKLCIIIENNKPDVLNTRVKDFYDIWKLLECTYNANAVENYFAKLIVDRHKTDVDTLDPSFLNEDFVNRHQQMWMDIAKKYEFLDPSVHFDSAVRVTRTMLNHEVEHFQRVRKK